MTVQAWARREAISGLPAAASAPAIAANSSIASARRAANSAPSGVCAVRPPLEHMLECYTRADERAAGIGGSAQRQWRLQRSCHLTLDVKFLVWITRSAWFRYPVPENLSVHSLGRT